MRADIHDGPEHNTLQSEAGYIGARPHIRQIDETLLQRTAGPYLWVIFVRSTRFRRSRHVRFAPIASEPSHAANRRGVPTADTEGRETCAIAPDVQAIFRRRRAKKRRTPHAAIRPGKPAPAMGPGTAATSEPNCIVR